MTRRISGSQATGLTLLLLLGCYGVAEFITMAADGVFDFISAVSLENSGYVIAQLAVGLLIAVAAVVAAISLTARSNRLAKTAGCLSLLSLVAGIAGQIWLAVYISTSYDGMGISYGDTFTSDWPRSNTYIVPFLVLIAIAGVLCLIGPSRVPAYGAASYPISPPPTAPHQQPIQATPEPTDPTFFVQVDGAEYGPYSAADIKGFALQGRVAPDTQIRPTGGYYEPARNVPGLFSE